MGKRFAWQHSSSPWIKCIRIMQVSCLQPCKVNIGGRTNGDATLPVYINLSEGATWSKKWVSCSRLISVKHIICKCNILDCAVPQQFVAERDPLKAKQDYPELGYFAQSRELPKLVGMSLPAKLSVQSTKDCTHSRQQCMTPASAIYHQINESQAFKASEREKGYTSKGCWDVSTKT